MVGVRTWSMAEIMWILDGCRSNYSIQQLCDQHRTKFPNNPHKSLDAGIRYVRDKYRDDPSYNQNFSKEEITFIMARRFGFLENIFKRISKLFEAEFPDHTWSAHADKPLAIESVIEKHNGDPEFCVKWEWDEIYFILRNKLRMKSWEALEKKFQTWRKRGNVTVDSLQYLYVMLLMDRVYPRIRIEEGYGEYWGSDPDGKERTLLDDVNTIKDDNWRITPYRYEESVSTYQSLTKRSRENDGDLGESQIKRARGSLHLLNPLKRLSHPPNPRYPPPGSKSQSPNSSLFEASAPIYSFPNSTPRGSEYNKRGQPCLITPTRNVPDQRHNFYQGPTRSNMWGGTFPANRTPEWSPIIPEYQHVLPPSHPSSGAWLPHTTPHVRPQETQPWMTSNFFGPARMGENQLLFPGKNIMPWQSGLNQVSNMQQSAPAMSALSDMVFMGENQIPFPDMNTFLGQAGCIPNGNWLELPPVIPNVIPDTLGMGGNQMLWSDINALPTQADFAQSGNFQKSAPEVLGDFSNNLGTEVSQTFQPNPGTLPEEAGCFTNDMWTSIEATVPGEFQNLLGAVESQMPYPDADVFSGLVDFADNGFHEPESTSSMDLSGVLELRDHQASHPYQDALPGQLRLTIEVDDGEEAQPATPFDTSSLFGSEDSAMLDSDLDALSGLGNSMTEYGIADIFSDIGAIGESQMPLDGRLSQVAAEDDGSNSELYNQIS